jgi:hypothetical protein
MSNLLTHNIFHEFLKSHGMQIIPPEDELLREEWEAAWGLLWDVYQERKRQLMLEWALEDFRIHILNQDWRSLYPDSWLANIFHTGWFYRDWYNYLFEEKDPDYSWWQVLKCRMFGHPAGVWWYNPNGLEPDMHCKGCGDNLG